MCEEDDLFDAFGEDDDDSDNENFDTNEEVPTVVNNEASSRAMAAALLKRANEKISQCHENIDTCNNDEKVSTDTNNESSMAVLDQEDLSYLKPIDDLHWNEPAFKGKIVLVSSLPLGGGRGYVATETLNPGTLVLVESPIMEWPEDQLGKKLGLVSIKYLLKSHNASQIIRDVEYLHPTKEQVDDSHHLGGRIEEDENNEQVSKMMQALQMEYSSVQQDVLDLVDVARKNNLCSRNGSALTDIDIIRLLLVLRYNGLESGLYRHVAMLNHDCYPNCCKLKPTDGTSSWGSEVRTTRLVRAGEVLTISYLPRVLSHASRRKLVWEQHRFDVGVHYLKGERYKMEIIGKKLPQSSVASNHQERLTDRIEGATEELERMQSDVEESFKSSASDSLTNIYTITKEIEQSVLTLYNEALTQLENPKHILLIPILALHIESCNTAFRDPFLTKNMIIGLLLRQTLSAYRLLPLKKALVGADHFEVAKINLDLANSVSELLSRSAQKLCDLNLTSMNSFAAWSIFEQNTRKEYKRIKALYPYDADQHSKAYNVEHH